MWMQSAWHNEYSLLLSRKGGKRSGRYCCTLTQVVKVTQWETEKARPVGIISRCCCAHSASASFPCSGKPAVCFRVVITVTPYRQNLVSLGFHDHMPSDIEISRLTDEPVSTRIDPKLTPTEHCLPINLPRGPRAFPYLRKHILRTTPCNEPAEATWKCCQLVINTWQGHYNTTPTSHEQYSSLRRFLTPYNQRRNNTHKKRSTIQRPFWYIIAYSIDDLNPPSAYLDPSTIRPTASTQRIHSQLVCNCIEVYDQQ
jgi:hypothetical protein